MGDGDGAIVGAARNSTVGDDIRRGVGLEYGIKGISGVMVGEGNTSWVTHPIDPSITTKATNNG